MRDSFVIYKSFFEIIKLLSDKKQAKMFHAICDYVCDGIEPNFEKETAMTAIWHTIEPQLKANNKRFVNSLKGGAPKGNENAKKQLDEIKKTTEQQPNNNQNTTKKQTNVNDNVNVNVNVINKERVREKTKAERFRPPTDLEVREYCKEMGFGVDAERFVNFYESKGWFVGKNPMKDWKSAVRSWEAKDKQSGSGSPKKYGDGSDYAFLGE